MSDQEPPRTKGDIGTRWNAAISGANAGNELGVTGKSSQETAEEYKKVVGNDPILKNDYLEGAANAQIKAREEAENSPQS